MILGLGIDTVSVSRLERTLALRRAAFLRKVLSEDEIEEGTRRARSASFLATRLAGREAFESVRAVAILEST